MEEQSENPTENLNLDPQSSFNPQPPNANPLDFKVFQALQQMVGARSSVNLTRLIDCYLAEASEQIGAMRKAIASGDAVTLRRAAHTLKSSSRSMGAISLSEFCKSLENLSQTGILEASVTTLLQLEDEYERVKAALQQER